MPVITIPDFVSDIIKKIEYCGFQAYAVGGCVRDAIMSQTPNDWDIATSAKPGDIAEIFPHVIPTGIKHGTVTVLFGGSHAEVTTFRIDGEYKDSRRPESVTFTDDICADLSRRDFTVNAMAYNPKTGIIDPFGGQADIKRKIIRAVGNPEARFREDALRIMRALRFSAVLGFDIEDLTSHAIRCCRGLLKNISAERIASELNKLMLSENPSHILRKYRLVFAQFLPEITPSFDFDQKNIHHSLDVWEHTLAAISASPPILPVRLALLFHDIAKPLCAKSDLSGQLHFKGHPQKAAEIANDAMLRLRYDNKTRHTVVHLVRMHDAPVPPNRASVKNMIRKEGSDFLKNLIEVKLADNLAKSPDYPDRYDEAVKLKEIFESVTSSDECCTLNQLALNGHDLIAAGCKPGAGLKLILDRLLTLVIEEKCKNEKDALLKALRKYF